MFGVNLAKIDGVDARTGRRHFSNTTSSGLGYHKMDRKLKIKGLQNHFTFSLL